MRRRRFARLGETQDTRSFGAAVWEFLNPAQVQREYEAVGKPIPTYGDIYEAALNDAITAARESARNAAEAAERGVGAALDVGKFALTAAAIVAVLYLFDSNRNRKRRK